MGKDFDNPDTYGVEAQGTRGKFVAFLQAVMTECLRVLKPGGHMLVWSLPRTSHWTALAIEDAGFEIRDCIHHLKDRSLDVQAFLGTLSSEQWEMLVRAAPTDGWVGHLFGCLSEDTEILTEHGWERFQTLEEGRLALCYDPEHGSFQWQPIQEVFVYPYRDTAFRLRGDHTDQIVSRNHRCLVERGGRTVFEQAEALSDREVVPVLEDLPGLLRALPLPGQRADETQGLLRRLFPGSEPSVQAGASDTACGVQGVRVALPPEGQRLDQEGQVLYAQVPGRDERGRPQGSREATLDSLLGSGGVDGGVARLVPSQDDRGQESGVEGRGDVLLQARELRVGEVREVPAGVPGDGPQGRVRRGAPACGGASSGATSHEEGSGASCQPQPHGQPGGQPDALRVEPGPQAVRASGYTRADLVWVEPFGYDGHVWCVRVPSGSFVARRVGKAFVTGNSGFPKSLNVSKQLDKKAGKKRKVVKEGKGFDPDRNKSGQFASIAPSDTGINTAAFNARIGEVTEPATEEAKAWDGWGTQLKPAVEGWWLCRKPLEEANVIAQVLKTGTGAMNIDASRIKTGEGDNIHAKNPHTESGFGREDSLVYGKSTGVSVYNPSQGRWPANLVLSHGPGCRKVGTRTMDAPVTNAYTDGMKPFGDGAGHPYVSTGGGTEEQPVFECDEGCPVKTIDEQGKERGCHSAGSAQVASFERRTHGTVYAPPSGGPGGARVGDDGGVSRFFRTFQPDVYECDEGCPVKEVNEQSGDVKVTLRAASYDNGPGGYHGAGGQSHAGNTYGDGGGAARFFQTFQPEGYECEDGCPVKEINEQSGESSSAIRSGGEGESLDPSKAWRFKRAAGGFEDKGGAARFFATFQSGDYECEESCPIKALDAQSGELTSGTISPDHKRNVPRLGHGGTYGEDKGTAPPREWVGDKGGASRFFQNFQPEGYECEEGCPVKALDDQSGEVRSAGLSPTTYSQSGGFGGTVGKDVQGPLYEDKGGASRFFGTFEPPFVYAPKAGKKDKNAGLDDEEGLINKHPTVKSQGLMVYLVRLITPKGGLVLDPFSGSGSTLVAAASEGFSFLGIEKDEEYHQIATRRSVVALARYEAEAAQKQAFASMDDLPQEE